MWTKIGDRVKLKMENERRIMTEQMNKLKKSNRIFYKVLLNKDQLDKLKPKIKG